MMMIVVVVESIGPRLQSSWLGLVHRRRCSYEQFNNRQAEDSPAIRVILMTREMGNLLVMHKAKCIIVSLTLIRPIIHPRRLCNKRHKQHMHGGKNEVHITNKLVERKLSFALVGFLQNRDCFRINNAD